GKDKTDKSLEVYKFYVNALYVAITRAVKNLYWIESSLKQPLLDLLGLRDAQASLQLAAQNSSLDAWRQEAHKLELQGKQEQAERIRSEILKQKTPNWEVITPTTLIELKRKAFEGNDKNAKMTLFEYGLVYEDRDILNSLLKADFKAAKHPDKGLQLLQQKHYSNYSFKKPDAVLKQVNEYGPDFRNIFNQTPLMVATWMSNTEVIKTLFDLGANTEKVDGNGLTAFQIALSQADRSDVYAKKKLPDIYEQLEPTSTSIQVDGRLIKLDKNSMEFFMLNLMIALFYRVMPKKLTYRVEGFSTQDFMAAVQHIPDSVLPERRKQRAYLSSILSKNEINKDAKNNRKLFYRVIRGAYIFNPRLALKVDDEWVNIYDLLSIDRLAPQYQEKQAWWYGNYNEHAEKGMAACKALLKQLIAKNQAELL
ncbi:MAG: ankyrin repeat domain-containing protein, partial [Methylococcales bacterium]